MSREKVAILRARAKALRERAITVQQTFTHPSMKARATAVLVAIERELERLEAIDAGGGLPALKGFLPAPTAHLKELEAILRSAGPHVATHAAASTPEPSRQTNRKVADPH
jgi:hypothetical protein